MTERGRDEVGRGDPLRGRGGLQRALWGLMVALVLTTGGGLGRPARSDTLTREEVVRLLDPPTRRKGSTSLGHTNAGQLVRPASLPAEGRGWVAPASFRERKTHFGTEALIATVTAALAEVAEAFPGSRLVVGNLGFASGQKIPWSASHQAGRDADLGMYARTTGGKRLEALPFVAYDSDGRASWAGRTVVFDDARNLALVRALVERRGTRVQYIFVARWLRARLLAEAGRQKVPRGIVERLEAVLHQPGDSSPHADHFHVRVACEPDDRLYGCQDRGPARDWIDAGERRLLAFIDGVGEVLATRAGRGSERLALRAVERLGALRHAAAAPYLLAALARPERGVRRAALAALRKTGAEEIAGALLGALASVRDVAWLKELLGVARAAATASAVPRFLALLADPGDALHPALGASRKARADAVAAIQVAAAGALGALGDAREAAQREALVGLLRSRDRGVVAAAHAALRGLTCIFHATPRDWGEEGPTARDLRGLGRFELVDRGFPEEARSRRGVTRLIKLLVHRDEAVRGCAGQALAAITGHAAEVRGRTPQKQRRFWQRWWDEHGARLRLPP